MIHTISLIQYIYVLEAVQHRIKLGENVLSDSKLKDDGPNVDGVWHPEEPYLAVLVIGSIVDLGGRCHLNDSLKPSYLCVRNPD